MKHTIKVAVEINTRALTLIGPNDSVVRWDYTVTLGGTVIASTCNGTYKSAAMAEREGLVAARKWASCYK